MPTKDIAKEIYFVVRNEEGTFDVPILVKLKKVEDLYTDSTNDV
ncbi:hypothetical protein [Bacillus wiedmannii]|nr:hypothetical protein [Bacillus wiedmannii]